jgi:titin
VSLSWTDASANETAFELQRCTGAGCTSYAALTTLLPDTTSYNNTGLTPGTSYSYRLRAVNGGGTSDWVGPATAVTPTPPPAPTAPTGVTATAVSSQRVDVAWTDTSSNETGFRVYRCTGQYSCGGRTLVATLPADSTAWSDLTVAASSYYGYSVAAYNAGGSAESAVVKLKTPAPTPPPAPTALKATAAGESEIDLTWTDTASPETGLELQRCTGAGCTTYATIVSLPAGTTAYANTSLVGGTSYSYRVRVVNGSATSAWSAAATAVTAPSSSLPPMPQGFTATAISAHRVDLAWTDVSALETGYRIYRCQGQYSCGGAVLLATVPANTTAYSDTTTAGSTYYGYQVEAFNATGARITPVVKVKTPKN